MKRAVLSLLIIWLDCCTAEKSWKKDTNLCTIHDENFGHFYCNKWHVLWLLFCPYINVNTMPNLHLAVLAGQADSNNTTALWNLESHVLVSWISFHLMVLPLVKEDHETKFLTYGIWPVGLIKISQTAKTGAQSTQGNQIQYPSSFSKKWIFVIES